MKTSTLLLAALALTPFFAAHADSPAVTKKSLAPRTITVSKAPKVLKKNVEYVFITNQAVTGSHLPLVVYSYNGKVSTSAPNGSYSYEDLAKTGQLQVGSALVGRDPAITFQGGRR